MSEKGLLERAVAALEALAGTGGSVRGADASTSTISPSGSSSAGAASAPTGEKRGRGRPPKDKTPAPEPAAADDADDLDFGGDEPGDDDFLGGEEAAPALTHDDVRKALVAYQARKDAKPNEAKGVLKKVGGVDVLTDLKPEKFAAVIAACKIK